MYCPFVSFSKTPLSEGSSCRACVLSCRSGVVWCRGLVLPWSRQRGLLTHPGTSGFPGWESSRRSRPDTGSLCGWKGCRATAESAVSPLPFKMRKAGVKSHFENLLLSVADTLETTPLYPPNSQMQTNSLYRPLKPKILLIPSSNE